MLDSERVLLLLSVLAVLGFYDTLIIFVHNNDDNNNNNNINVKMHILFG